jgi:hypothetical protein
MSLPEVTPTNIPRMFPLAKEAKLPNPKLSGSNSTHDEAKASHRVGNKLKEVQKSEYLLGNKRYNPELFTYSLFIAC